MPHALFVKEEVEKDTYPEQRLFLFLFSQRSKILKQLLEKVLSLKGET